MILSIIQKLAVLHISFVSTSFILCQLVLTGKFTGKLISILRCY